MAALSVQNGTATFFRSNDKRITSEIRVGRITSCKRRLKKISERDTLFLYASLSHLSIFALILWRHVPRVCIHKIQIAEQN